MVGGDEENTNLWMSDREGQVWRKSVPLPYGEGRTSYGATLVTKEDKVGFIFNLTTCKKTKLFYNSLQVYLTGGHNDSSDIMRYDGQLLLVIKRFFL